MTRLLLALLALVGIVAQAPVAEARPCAHSAEVGVMAAQAVATRALVACVAEAAQPEIPRNAVVAVPVPALRSFALPGLTVRIGTDRALQ